jgi:hypothetical protein
MILNVLNDIRKKGRAKRYILQFASSVADPLLKINLRKLQSIEPRISEEDERSYYSRLQTLAKEGPIFSSKVIQSIESLPDRYLPNEKKHFVIWLANRLNAGDELASRMLSEKPSDTWTNIRDFLNAESDLNFKDFFSLAEGAELWHEELAANMDDSISIAGDPVVYRFDNGYKIVEVRPENLALEGKSMGHCVGDYCDDVKFGGTTIYSLRSKEDRPLVTIEIEDGLLRQIKGRQNSAPIEKYRKYIIQWLDSMKEKVDLYSRDYFNILSDKQMVTVLERDPKTFVLQGEEIKRMIQSRKIEDPRLPRLLEDLAKSGEEISVEFAARNINTPTDTLKELAHECLLNPSEMRRVAIYLAENKGATEEVLHMLSRHPDDDIKWSVSKNPMTAPQTVYILSTTNSKIVQRALSERSFLSPEVINNLVKSSDFLVLEKLAIRSDLPYASQLQLFDRQNDRIWFLLARNQYVDPRILEKIAMEGEALEKMMVAENPVATSEVLNILATDSSTSVREKVARHPNCSAEALELFLTTTDNEGGVSATGMEAIKNPSLTSEVIMSILSKANLDETRIFFKNLAYLDRQLPTQVYEKMSKHKNINIRMFVAEHKHTPSNILKSMGENDPDANVQYAARSTLRLKTMLLQNEY